METPALSLPANLPLNMTGASHAQKPADLKKACQQFEGYFLNLMFKEMRKSIPKSTVLKDDAGQEQTFQEMMDQKVSDVMSERGDFGLAKMMYVQLTRADIVNADGTPVPAPGVDASEETAADAGKSSQKPNAPASKTRQWK
ncbi:hypothetical protein CCAX7_003520 [Capsulimonas corticalis]|uniref:Uncharacterized protein n=1 Tax=Capsulimonas corticalis TaxID=2219043 RepID=A0A402CS98_9BACT|nr:rod-binding protein [Capsulimonas corticalis]BDI28301.1 hypothetical protein CCAX7_003520 [Capsulimonas corticalis]